MFPSWLNKRKNGDRLAVEAMKDYERSGDELHVIQRLKQALALGLVEIPHDRVYVVLGAAYDDVGLYEEAEQAYERALAQNARNSTALSNLGLLANRQGDWARARELFERAIEVKPNNGFAHNNLGYFLLSRGENAEAQRLFARATELDPTLTVAFANLARCYGRLGDFTAAQAAFLQASQRGYDQIEGLQRELMEASLSRPKVYFDGPALLRLAAQLLPGDAQLLAQLQRAVDAPDGLYAELTAKGRTLFLTHDLLQTSLGWLLLCDALLGRGRALRDESRSLESWIALMRAALELAGTPLTERHPRELAAELREKVSTEGSVDDEAAVEAWLDELTESGRLLLLRLWQGPGQAILCPISSDAWQAADYPLSDGPSGIGMIDVMGRKEPEPAARQLH